MDTPTKATLLRKYMDDDIFGSTENGFDNDFKTLKIRDVETLKLDKRPKLDISPSLSSGSHQYKKVSLSQYSESETDATSQMNEDDFEDLELLADEESHIKMNQVLRRRKSEIEREAAAEEERLQERYSRSLRLSHQNLSLLDQIHNDSVKFETEDDFGEGWDLNDVEKGIEKGLEKGLDIGASKKTSMPLIRPLNAPRRYKSAVDMSRRKKNEHDDYLPVKHDNSVIKRLDRIPSFYNVPKKQQLEKYQEKPGRTPKKRSDKIGLLRYLNHVPQDTKTMRYNAEKKRWEGNECDLMRFESRPALIPKDSHNDNRNPNMVYDEERLCWVNLEDEDNVLDIPDLDDRPKNLKPPIALKGSVGNFRGISHSTQRTVSSAIDEDEEEFTVSSRLVERFKREEDKILKKTANWFEAGARYGGRRKGVDGWEVRKMVME